MEVDRTPNIYFPFLKHYSGERCGGDYNMRGKDSPERKEKCGDGCEQYRNGCGESVGLMGIKHWKKDMTFINTPPCIISSKYPFYNLFIYGRLKTFTRYLILQLLLPMGEVRAAPIPSPGPMSLSNM